MRAYAGANGVTGDSSTARLEQGLSVHLTSDKEIGITTQVGLTDSAPDFLGGLFLRLSL
jgi:hypothetical protein